MAYVYKHLRNDTNEVFYVGIGRDTAFKRAYSAKSRNRYWNFITNKTRFTVEIIEYDLTWEEACEKEKWWIKFYGRKDLNEGSLVNMTDGGDGVCTLTDLSRSSISNKAVDRLKNKKNHPMYGKRHSIESKIKNRETQLNNKNNVGDKNHRWVGIINKNELDFALNKCNSFRELMKLTNRSQKVIQRSILFHYGKISFHLLVMIHRISKEFLLNSLKIISKRKFCKTYKVSQRTLNYLCKYYCL